MVSRSGGIYTTSDGGQTLTGPFGVVPAADSVERQRLAASVETIKATADGSTFPMVDVAVVALDKAGHRVDGLGAADFTVEEEGKPAPFDLVANGAPSAVRLLIMYDASGSVTETWAAPAAKERFETALARALTTAARRAPFSVQVIGLGGRAESQRLGPADGAGSQVGDGRREVHLGRVGQRGPSPARLGRIGRDHDLRQPVHPRGSDTGAAVPARLCRRRRAGACGADREARRGRDRVHRKQVARGPSLPHCAGCRGADPRLRRGAGDARRHDELPPAGARTGGGTVRAQRR